MIKSEINKLIIRRKSIENEIGFYERTIQQLKNQREKLHLIIVAEELENELKIKNGKIFSTP